MYILTKQEKKILENYLNSEVKLNGFSVLILRLKRAAPKLRADLQLVDSILKKS